MFSLIRQIHGRMVFGRRVRVISEYMARLIPPGASVLDIGCGSGQIASQLKLNNPTISIRGIEVSPRPGCLIACEAYDGSTIPHGENSFDCCMFIDVLHHTRDIAALLKEARRVSRRYILIKDHLCETRFDKALLSLMDWVGNRPYSVNITYNYFGRDRWDTLFKELDVRTGEWTSTIPLYAFPLNLLFARGLHFIALLEKS